MQFDTGRHIFISGVYDLMILTECHSLINSLPKTTVTEFVVATAICYGLMTLLMLPCCLLYGTDLYLIDLQVLSRIVHHPLTINELWRLCSDRLNSCGRCACAVSRDLWVGVVKAVLSEIIYKVAMTQLRVVYRKASRLLYVSAKNFPNSCAHCNDTHHII